MRHGTTTFSSVGARVCAIGAFAATLILGLHATKDSAEAREVVDRVEARVELGRRLFLDPAISQSGVKSCVECHDPEHGYSDPNTLSADENGPTPRHSQTLIDAKFNPSVHWDGEFASIEAAVLTRLGRSTRSAAYYGGARVPTPPPTAPITPRPSERAPITGANIPKLKDLKKAERALLRTVPSTLTASKRYDEAFYAAFGSSDITLAKVARALGDYTRSIESTESSFDRFIKGDATALDRSAFRGLALFRGRAGCVQCHSMDVDPKAEKSLFTDWDYRNTGIADLRTRAMRGQARSRIRSVIDAASVGRRMITGRPEDDGCFKTPSLRDVAKTAPYMHDGSIKTLEEVVEFYARGCNKLSRNLDAKIKPFEASEQDVADLVAFLRSLSGEKPAGRADKAWSRRARSTALTFLRAGKPVADMTVVLEGIGEKLPGIRAPRRIELTTNGYGKVTFAPGAYTHMRVVRPSPARNPIDWVPDTVRKLKISLPAGTQ